MNKFFQYFEQFLKEKNDVSLKIKSCYSPENIKFIDAPTAERKDPPRS